MLRHKSTPCLFLATTNTPLSGCSDYSHHHHRGDDLQDRYYTLQDQHLELRREANEAQDQIRMLNTRLSRLLAEKKRFYRNVKSEREIVMEEKLFEMERMLRRQEQQNERLKERLQLMRLNNFVTTTNDHRRPKSSTISSTQSRVSSTYSHVRSRTDSGLGFYFRPLSLNQQQQKNIRQRTLSQTDLQPRSVKFQEPSENHRSKSEETTSDPTKIQLPLMTTATATELMQEAKEEILRLESVVAKQQQVIDSFMTKNSISNNDLGSKSMLSYTIMTTNLTTAPSNNSNMTTSPMINGNGNDAIIDNDNDNQTIEALWLKYQQIMMHKESFQRVSLECQQLIERLYQAVKQERHRCEQLKAKLQNSTPMIEAEHHSPVIMTKNDKIIETLRKENSMLQNSLKQCMDQCIMVIDDVEQQQSNGGQLQLPQQQYAIDRVQELWRQKRRKYEEQIIELDKKLYRLSEDFRQQERENESLRLKYENLKQLNENDQLKIGHLEQKVRRLSKILFFDRDDDKCDVDYNINHSKYSNQHRNSLMMVYGATNNNQDESNELDNLLSSFLMDTTIKPTIPNHSQKNSN